jgi:tetratricopeptide (TPR) repeat protein
MTVAPRPLRGIHQRLTLPPPPRRASLAAFFRLNVEDDLAWALFLVARRVRDLAEFPPEGIGEWKHGEEIRAVAAGTPEIAQPLSFLADACWVDEDTQKDLARASHRIAQWAGEQGFGELAVQFAEAAVALLPNSARANYEAGRMNRLFGNTGEAAVFYSRAICLARKKRWSVYVRAHLGMGLLCEARGQRERAAAHYSTASQAAWSASGERWLAALTEHDLLMLKVGDGDYAAAFQHARTAYLWMPKHHPNIPKLAHDYCLVLLGSSAGSIALELLDATLMSEIPILDKIVVWSTLARAAGMLGRLDRFREADKVIDRHVDALSIHAAAVHANRAMGAHALGLVAEAERHALRCIEVTTELPNAIPRRLAENVLEKLQSGERAGPPPFAADVPTHLARLAQNFAARLKQWRGPTWKRKRHSARERLGTV